MNRYGDFAFKRLFCFAPNASYKPEATELYIILKGR